MQVKYIVYYVKNTELPRVDIWQTSGDILHPVYAVNHDISTKNISSMGDLFFNPRKKRWELEHWQMDDEISLRIKLRKRDKALVQKKIHETDFLNDKQVQNQCQKLSLFRRIFQHN